MFEKIDEELVELQTARADEDSAAIQEEFGDLLFTIVSLGRHLGFDSEQALRLATQKFESRIETVNRLAKAQGIDLAIALTTKKMDYGIRLKLIEPRVIRRIE